MEEANGQPQITVEPGANGHGAARVVKALTAIPLEGIGVAFVSVAGEARRHTVFRDAEATAATGPDMVDGFRWLAAVDAGMPGVLVERLTPPSDAELGTEFLEEHRIALMHPNLPDLAQVCG